MPPATPAAAQGNLVSVMYRGTRLRATESFSVGVIAVLKDRADILDKDGKVVFPGKAVICQRIEGLPPEDRRQAGTPVTVLNPGENHKNLILPKAKATKVNPIRTIQKEFVRPIGTCPDSRIDSSCKNCCNHPRRK